VLDTTAPRAGCLAWSTAPPQGARAREISYPRDGAALLSSCHGLGLRRGRGPWPVAVREREHGAEHRTRHHQTAATGAGRGGGPAPTRGRGSRQPRRVAAHMAPDPEAPGHHRALRGSGGATALRCVGGQLDVGVRWLVDGTLYKATRAAWRRTLLCRLPPRGSDSASADRDQQRRTRARTTVFVYAFIMGLLLIMVDRVAVPSGRPWLIGETWQVAAQL